VEGGSKKHIAPSPGTPSAEYHTLPGGKMPATKPEPKVGGDHHDQPLPQSKPVKVPAPKQADSPATPDPIYTAVKAQLLSKLEAAQVEWGKQKVVGTPEGKVETALLLFLAKERSVDIFKLPNGVKGSWQAISDAMSALTKKGLADVDVQINPDETESVFAQVTSDGAAWVQSQSAKKESVMDERRAKINERLEARRQGREGKLSSSEATESELDSMRRLSGINPTSFPEWRITEGKQGGTVQAAVLEDLQDAHKFLGVCAQDLVTTLKRIPSKAHLAVTAGEALDVLKVMESTIASLRKQLVPLTEGK
jgi:hypothetical protein